MLTTSPVRKARLEDKPQIMEMCEENWKENGQFSLDLRKVEALIDRAFSGGGAIIGIVGKDVIEGMLTLTINQFWYSSDWVLEETQNYVRPEYRRSTNAKDMIKFAQRCSDELGIPLVIGVVSNERTKAKMELYRRQLGDPVGGYYLYPRNSVPPAA
jgi:hypothetical protein